MKTALTIAGTDPSGGAGIQADIKTMTANGVFATCAVTALVAQNTTGVKSIVECTPDFLAEELDCVFTDIFPDAVKTGMVSSIPLIRVIAAKLKEYGAKNLVVDPVMGDYGRVYQTYTAAMCSGMARLAELAPTATANTGFVSLAGGGQGWFIISLVIVTSVAVWAQPQMIQRHFALNSARQVNRITPLAMLVLTVLVGGAYYVASLARLFMPEVASPDDVMPALVKMLLPDIGLQLFVLAIVSASLSTATAIFHIAVAAIAEDLPGRKTSRGMWVAGIVFCVLLSGGCAQIKGQIIAMLCTTSWSIVGSTVLVAYVALVRFGKRSGLAAWCSCCAGFVSCMLWYLMTHPQFAILPMPWPSLATVPPFFVGFAFSLAGWGLGWALDGEGRRNSSFWPAGMKPGM